MSQIITGPPIKPGFKYPDFEVTVQGEPADDVLFPEGCELRAQIRSRPGGRTLIDELTSDNGGIVRVSDDTVRVSISKVATSAIRTKTVSLDIVRTDVDPEYYTYVEITIPVGESTTK